MATKEEILARIRAGVDQCPSEPYVPLENEDVTVRDQCLDAEGHDGDHQGLFGAWPE